MASFWEKEICLAEVEKGNELIRVRQVERKGVISADIRIFYQDSEGEWKPSKRGILLPHDSVEEIAEVLSKWHEGSHGVGDDQDE